MKVSWQVTGIRRDPAADAYRIVVETEKPGHQVGKYLNPEVFSQPKVMGIHFMGRAHPIRASGETER